MVKLYKRINRCRISNDKKLIKVCDFVNLPFEKKLLKIDLSNSNIGRWESDFTSYEKDRILPLLGETMNLLGYE